MNWGQIFTQLLQCNRSRARAAPVKNAAVCDGVKSEPYQDLPGRSLFQGGKQKVKNARGEAKRRAELVENFDCER